MPNSWVKSRLPSQCCYLGRCCLWPKRPHTPFFSVSKHISQLKWEEQQHQKLIKIDKHSRHKHLQATSIAIWLFNIAMEDCPFIDGSPIKNGMSITRRLEKLINIPWARGWLHPRVSMAHPTANRLDVETPPEKNAIGGRNGTDQKFPDHRNWWWL